MSDRAWVDAGNLEAGDRLLASDGTLATVVARHNTAGPEVMRDLTVAETHTYNVMAADAPVLVHNCDPVAGGGAKLENISAADAARIQEAADRIGKPIHVVGSRAKGTARAESDWDYVVTGANSKAKDKVKWLAPKGFRRGQGSGQDIITGPLIPDTPHTTFFPKGQMWMSAVEDVRILDRDGNWAVIWLPGRRFPGVFLQGDTMSTIRDLLADLDAESLHGLGEDVRDRILEARERLDELMAYYEATLVANGIPRPF